jgi:hypothetical protein
VTEAGKLREVLQFKVWATSDFRADMQGSRLWAAAISSSENIVLGISLKCCRKHSSKLGVSAKIGQRF